MSSVYYKNNYKKCKGLILQEKIKKKVTARGLRRLAKASEGVNHRGQPSGRRYAIIPSRAVYSPDLSPNDLLLLCALGLFVSRQGVSYPTYETIRNCTGLGPVQVSASLKRLINAGMIRKLQPKWFKNQTSKWLTSRYQVLFSSNDPIPTDEELKSSIPFATDQPEDQVTYAQLEQKTSELEREENEKLKGIERGVKSMSQTYGYTIQTDNKSLLDLAAINPTRDQIAMAFRNYVTRFGSLPTTLQMLIARGMFA
jgi:hypothetical protein